MSTRRQLILFPRLTLAQFRFLGWIFLMMFVLVQTAAGASSDAQVPDAAVRVAMPPALWSSGDIGRNSFVVYQDSTRIPVKDVEPVHVPLSVGVLLEGGGRYRGLNRAIAENVSKAAQGLLDAVDPQDRIALWTYGATVQRIDAPQVGASGLRSTFFDLPVAPSSESNFHDAVLNTLPRLQEMPGPKVLLVVSTGIDTFSKASFTDVLKAVRQSGVPVCVVDIGPMVRPMPLPDMSENDDVYSHLDWQRASGELSRLAQTSGCRVLRPDSALELPSLYDGLLAGLHLQYVIHYQPPGGVPQSRGVQVALINHAGKPVRLPETLVRPLDSTALADAGLKTGGARNDGQCSLSSECM